MMNIMACIQCYVLMLAEAIFQMNVAQTNVGFYGRWAGRDDIWVRAGAETVLQFIRRKEWGVEEDGERDIEGKKEGDRHRARVDRQVQMGDKGQDYAK